MSFLAKKVACVGDEENEETPRPSHHPSSQEIAEVGVGLSRELLKPREGHGRGTAVVPRRTIQKLANVKMAASHAA